MASIKKLGITGIRSYNPDEETIIEFFKPLTLILGRNGGGKTTIIECLKMLVCGSFPPNSQSGKTFICDPKIVNRPEVKAKIQLVFKAINNKDVLGVRTFQLTHTEKKTEFRQIEQVLKTKDAVGKTVSITHTCAEMDRQIPELLGVSQAVLENVIFCHQEESLWPFGDIATLKKIFDELFDTTMYTNLLEHLRKLQKEHKKAHKDASAAFEIEKKDFDLYSKKKKQLVKNMEDVSSLQDDMKEYERRIKILLERKKMDFEKNSIAKDLNLVEFRMADNKRLQNKHVAVDGYSKQSIDDLKVIRDEMTIAFARKEQEIKNLEIRNDALGKKLHETQRDFDNLVNAEKDSSETSIKLKDCRDKILALVTIKGVGNELDEKSNERIVNACEEHLLKIQQEYQRSKEDVERSETKTSEEWSNLSSECKMKKENLRKSEQEILELNKKIATLEKELAQLSRNSAKKDLEDPDEIAERIENLKEEKSNNEQAMRDKMQEQVDAANKIAENQSKRDLLKKRNEYQEMQGNVEKLQSDCETLEGECWTLFTNLQEISDIKIDSQAPLDSIVGRVETYKKKLTAEKDSTQAKRDKILDAVKDADSFIQIKTNDLLKKQAEVKKFTSKLEETKLTSLIEKDGDFNSKYQEIKEEYRSKDQKVLAMKYTEDILKQFYDNSKIKKKCTLCSKKLEDSDVEKLAQKQTELIKKSAQQTQDEVKALAELKEQKEMFKKLKYEYEDYAKNRDIMRQLEKEINAREKDKTLLQQQINHFKTTLENYTNILNVVEQITTTAEKINKIQTEIKDQTLKIAKMERDYPSLKKADLATQRVLDDKQLKEQQLHAKEEYARLEKLIRQAEHDIVRFEEKKVQVEYGKRAKEEEAKQISHKQEELNSLKKKKAENESMLPKLKSEIDALSIKVQKAENLMREIKAESKRVEEEYANKRGHISLHLPEFKKLCELWIMSQKKKNKRKESDSARKTLSDEIDNLTAEINENGRKIATLKEQVGRKEDALKTIDDNIALKTLQKDMLELQKEHARLQQAYQISLENEHFNKQIDDQVQNETDKLNQTKGKYSMKINEYESGLKELKQKLPACEKTYIEQLFQREINEYVADDLDIYISNLEKSLMIFHKQKMEEINKIISDLWIKTYKGADIKKIEIKSDVEPANQRNKSYNYRIVFHNQDGRELDMKGRCSMGQKVIASIVIRLALAEAFCTNCGILALDEPTTNLDKEHIKKLAKELSGLIKHRMNNANFQLIVITHDKEFVRELGEHAEKYYKVYKDVNSFSKVESEETRKLV